MPASFSAAQLGQFHEFLLLKTLAHQPQYGYALTQNATLRRQWHDTLHASTLYAVLNRLCQQGYVEKTVTDNPHGPHRHMYALTNRGQRYLRLLGTSQEATLHQTLETYLKRYLQCRQTLEYFRRAQN